MDDVRQKLNEVIAQVNAGGWRFQMREYGPSADVTSMGIGEGILGVLNIQNGSDMIQSLRVKNITEVVVTADPIARRIVMYGTGIVKEQRKKAEGGGWRDVPRTRIFARFVHTEAENAHQGRRATEQAMAEKERKVRDEEALREKHRQEAEAAQKAAEEYRLRVEDYVTRQNKVLADARFKRFSLQGDKIIVEFDNDRTIVVSLVDHSEFCDVCEAPSSLGITVAGETL